MTQQSTQTETQGQGVLFVAADLFKQLFTIDAHPTIENGTIAHADFALVKKVLLLPEEYTIESIILGHEHMSGSIFQRLWSIMLRSNALPIVSPDQEVPTVQFVYQHEINLETNVTTVSLAEIRIVDSNNKPRNIYHPATKEERPHVTRQYIPITTSTINP